MNMDKMHETTERMSERKNEERQTEHELDFGI